MRTSQGEAIQQNHGALVEAATGRVTGAFCAMLPQLLEGEDPDFVACITTIAEEEHAADAHRAHARLS
jgi:hypothetical protein